MNLPIDGIYDLGYSPPAKTPYRIYFGVVQHCGGGRWRESIDYRSKNGNYRWIEAQIQRLLEGMTIDKPALIASMRKQIAAVAKATSIQEVQEALQ